MGWLDRVLGNDHERAARYDAPSASETAAAKRRTSYWKSGVARAAREGQAWEDRDRQQDRKGKWYRAAR